MALHLAIETSQRIGSVALRAESGTIHVEQLRAHTGGRHGDDLMPAIDRLFCRIDAKPRALRTVAVSIGPGGFTGLRIAVSTAKMLSETLRAKIIAVPSAMVAAENCDSTHFSAAELSSGTHRIVVALASKRETFWATHMHRMDGLWRIGAEPGLMDAESFMCADFAAVIADEHLPVKARECAIAAGVPIVTPHFDASACLRVAERLASDGAYADPLSLLPLYPRPPEAVTIWESREKKSPPSR